MKAPGLRSLRDVRLLTIRELADKAKVSPTTIVRVEAGGEAYATTIRKLATALKCKAADLIGA